MILLQFARLNNYLRFQTVEERMLWSLFASTIHQTLMELTTSSTVHITFRHMSDLSGGNNTYATAYCQMLQCTSTIWCKSLTGQNFEE